jgi:hypothetical protein
MPRTQKWVGMAFRYLEPTFQWNHQSRNLINLEGRLWVLRAISLLETAHLRIRPFRFIGCPWIRKWVHMAFRHLQTSLHRIQNVVYKTNRRQIMCPHGHSPTSNITSATLFKSPFWMPRM